MDQKLSREESLRIKAREILSKMSLDELSYTLGRYCGPSNCILSEKKFGLIMPKDLVEKELENRSFEEILLAEDQ